MLRTLAFLFALTAPATAQVTGSLGPASPLLKRSVTVASDVVRIGDLIDNAGAASRIPIFRAPDLGTAGTVPAEQVLQAARAHSVIGVDAAGVSEVLVTRASRVIAVKELESHIARALSEKLGLAGDSEIMVRFDRNPRPLHVESTATAPLQITRLTFEPRTGHFEAALEIPGSTMARRLPLRFSGTAMETVETAILARPLARGEIVRRSDVVMERRPKSEAGAQTGNIEQFVGLALRRAARAGQMLGPADLMRPELVQRNENVTLIFEAPGIMLTSRAKALETGAEGDLISVLNLQSKRTVQGIVTGPSTVAVTAMKPRVAAVASADPASLKNPSTE
jgi:flagella basal body P-ring formation protein FlgA